MTREELLIENEKLKKEIETLKSELNQDIEFLANSENFRDRVKAATRTDNEEVLSFLSGDRRAEVREAVAANENTPEGVLHDLSEDKSSKVINAVIQNEHTLEDTLFDIISNSNNRDREDFLDQFKDRNLSADFLENLSNEEDILIKEFVASHKDTPENVLEDLSNIENKFIKETVAQNENTSPETLEKIFDFVKENDSELNKLFSNDLDPIKEALAANPNTPEEILDNLSQDKDSVKLLVAQNLKTSSETLGFLAFANNSTVADEAMFNPSFEVSFARTLLNLLDEAGITKENCTFVDEKARELLSNSNPSFAAAAMEGLEEGLSQNSLENNLSHSTEIDQGFER